MPKGYEETMQYGMISYVVPLRIFPEGYLGQKDVPLIVEKIAKALGVSIEELIK